MIARLTLLLAAAASFSSALAEPKKLLVVTVTTGFRHSSIETAEKVLAEIGQKSGAFTVDYVHQPEGQPKNPGKPPVKGDKDSDEAFKAKQETYSKALADFNAANKVWNDKIKAYMADKMAIEKIKHYDGFVFANTTGDLQFPDRDGFVELIKGGKAFIAMHSGSDTYHPFRGYVDMLGGEFQTHKAQVEVQPVVHSPLHPAAKPPPPAGRSLTRSTSSNPSTKPPCMACSGSTPIRTMARPATTRFPGARSSAKAGCITLPSAIAKTCGTQPGKKARRTAKTVLRSPIPIKR